LENGKNLTPGQAERWAGDYHLTVLDEAIQKLAPCLGATTGSDLVLRYPAKSKTVLEEILHDIGTDDLGFKDLRSKTQFWGSRYGLQKASPPAPTPGSPAPTALPPKKASPPAYAQTDPKSVNKALREFKISGNGREKIVALLGEMKGLRVDEFPYAFCFLLRSMFELSAKAYCQDHKKSNGPSATKSDGNDRNLIDILRDIEKHLTKNSADRQKEKLLHGAMTVLAERHSMLSVTSLNQLIHNPIFPVGPADISLLFWKVFPFLKETTTVLRFGVTIRRGASFLLRFSTTPRPRTRPLSSSFFRTIFRSQRLLLGC
jgi:hypothetical protein